MTAVRVLILGGHELNRYGLRMAMERACFIDVVGDAAFGQQAEALVQSTAPDVVLIDTVEPCARTCAMTRQVLTWRPGTRILVVATELCDCSHEVLRAGARGLLLKDVGPVALAEAVQALVAGYGFMPAGVQRRVCEAGPGPARPAPDARIERLSGRERDVLACLATGGSNAEIARCLQLGEGTVKSHIQHILTKLCLRDRVQAVIFAYQSRFVQVPDPDASLRPCVTPARPELVDGTEARDPGCCGSDLRRTA
jgi:DNA-binding NarL/FixJ family response regulator